jgi:outer membrane protein OmpA-like peptidoglycan-associated protein
MQLRSSFSTVLFFLIISGLHAQTDNFLIAKAPFSTQKYSEFSPVYYRKSIVFCSNRDPAKISGYSTMDKKGFFKIYSADTTGANKQVTLLPGTVNSHLNNGPVTFSPGGDTIYFSRNLLVDGNFRDISGTDNKLGLFYAVLKNGEWTDVTELRFNDNSWNVTTPCLSADGKRLYFASDKPGGFGGSDLYYSDWKKGYWNNAINLGSSVNTGGNEAYPFVNGSGDLFFSSDSLPGKGGKDIFFTRYADSAWIRPVALSSPVNSPANDFGFISDNILKRGYFSTDRGGEQDIYSFRTVFPQFLYCPEQQAPKSCYGFSDDTTIRIDPGQLQFRWNFGEGRNIDGLNVQHCYEKQGRYTVREDVIDTKTGRRMFNKLVVKIDIMSSDLPFIVSDDFSSSGMPVSLTAGLESSRYEIISAYWELGSEGRARGVNITPVFKSGGETVVKLLANLRERSTGKLRQTCVSKILRTGTDAAFRQKENNSTGVTMVTPGNMKKLKNVEVLYSAKDQISNNAVFRVQLLSSKKKLQTNDRLFSNLSPDYQVRSSSDEDGNYYYFIEEQQTLMETLYSFRKAVALGYKEAVVAMHIPSEGAELEIWTFKKNHGTSSDNYFMNNGYSLAPRVVPVLDELVLILKRNPEIRLLVEAHTDNSKDPLAAVTITQKQAKGIVDYLTDHGIPASRLVAAGYGSARPVAADLTDADNKRNRRVDFIPLFQ